MTILSNKVKALRNDVQVCTHPSANKQAAPFAALLSCFSCLDFLSALYCGDASTGASTTSQVKKFLERFFNYDRDQRELLLEIYRHKLVHLFQPGNVVEYEGHTYSWAVYISEQGEHLKIIEKNELINPAPCVKIKIEYLFSISIQAFLDEIVQSSEDYYDNLKNDINLQKNFEGAVEDIFSL